MRNWFAGNLGDATLAGESMDHGKALFLSEYEKANRPADVAVFVRHESQGRLHCEVKIYFSPASAVVAEAVDAVPCRKPSSDGLGLLAGSPESWPVLFPEHGIEASGASPHARSNRRWHLRTPMAILLKRAYESPGPDDGFRILVDRLWPRGVSRRAAHIDLWLKDVAPSTALRKWFGHDPSKWVEFRQRYFLELRGKPEAIGLLNGHVRRGVITLVYGAKDTEHNDAVALREYLENSNEQQEQ
jgi:uncharacterized protein YeaO (DUF488 family)